jgi:asparagine synthase (glutamine-hydrolysing)
MPGIVGLVAEETDFSAHTAIVQSMRELIRHADSYVDDPVAVHAPVVGARTHPGLVNVESQPCEWDGLVVWLDGELCNTDCLKKTLPTPARGESLSQAELFARLFRQDSRADFLEDIDGIYSAVVFDKRSRLVHFFTDRYGLQFLYYSQIGATLAWSSETKAFLAVPGFDTSIDATSVEEFFERGHLREDRTWFAKAKLFPKASWWSWSLDELRFVAKRQYWDWDRIKVMAGRLDRQEVAEELARLFRAAVEIRSTSAHQVGVTLSGGLDSRAVFAAVPENVAPLPAATFGMMGCDDIRIAKLVANQRTSRHRVFELNEKNWLRNRGKCAWWLDGHLDILHAHFIVHCDQVRELFAIDLSGFLGDATIGGSYITGRGEANEFAALDNRGRRFIGYGLQQERLFGHARIPFFDNQFLSFALSVPPRHRRGSRMYFAMLKHLMPPAYWGIPWQKTGCPIPSSAVIPFFSYHGFVRGKKLFRGKLGVGGRSSDYHDYPRWVLGEVGQSFFRGLFAEATRPLLYEFTDLDDRLLSRPHHSLESASILTRAATLELWLRAVYAGTRCHEYNSEGMENPTAH